MPWDNKNEGPWNNNNPWGKKNSNNGWNPKNNKNDDNNEEHSWKFIGNSEKFRCDFV